MRWYWLSCPQCGWQAPEPVTEDVAKQFANLKYCRECERRGKPRSNYVMREVITNTPKGKDRNG